jgi:tRNA(Ile)-lysidine synthase
MSDISDHLADVFQKFLNRHHLTHIEKMALAVSGGPDSMAMADIIWQFAKDQKISLHILTVDHGLRDNAKAEAQMVADWVGSKKSERLKHKILKWEEDKPDTAIMEAARSARYELMAEYCSQHDIEHLAVAHHQDDQAETFLIRLAKGSGLDGLSAMQDIRDLNENLKILRPFLTVTKEELIKYCDDHKIPYVHDPSNDNDDYLRPRLRQSMDVLAEEGLTSKRLATTANRIGRARQALEEIADNAFQACLLEKDDNHHAFDWNKLKACPEEIVFRVVQSAMENQRVEADYNIRMDRLENLFESLWLNTENFKPRTLGGFKISIKNQPQLMLMIEKE